jgi:hypothetical protein
VITEPCRYTDVELININKFKICRSVKKSVIKGPGNGCYEKSRVTKKMAKD